jgi:hypothetical protein
MRGGDNVEWYFVKNVIAMLRKRFNHFVKIKETYLDFPRSDSTYGVLKDQFVKITYTYGLKVFKT